MSRSYAECGPDEYTMAEELIGSYFPDLQRRGVTIRLRFASAPDGQNAITHHGRAAAGLAKINSLSDRADGMTDCTVTLDRGWWVAHPDRQRRALLHHELHHFAPDEKKDDDCGRPVVRLRKHDWEMGGFDAVMHLYGPDSVEHRFVDHVVERRRQGTLKFMDVAEGDEGEEQEVA